MAFLGYLSVNGNNYRLTRRKMVQALAGIAACPIAAATADKHPFRAAIFFESYATVAFQRALRYAGDDGFVASMPQLLHARCNAEYDNIIWNTWFTANSEENIVTTPAGNTVVLTVHGGGVFADPGRFERSLRADLRRDNREGLTAQYAARLTEKESQDLLRGRLPGGDEIPVYTFHDIKQGIKGLPMQYGVSLDFETAKSGARNYVSFDILRGDPNMIIRAGGAEYLHAYLDKAQQRHDTESMGNWHSHQWIDSTDPQARILNIGGNRGGIDSEGKDTQLGWGYDADDGIGASWPAGLARYVAVAPRDDSISLGTLDFVL